MSALKETNKTAHGGTVQVSRGSPRPLENLCKVPHTPKACVITCSPPWTNFGCRLQIYAVSDLF